MRTLMFSAAPMSPRIGGIAAALAATLALTSCSGDGSSESSQDAAISLQNCGQTVTLTEPADAAITVNQGATESALAVGAGDQLAATAYLDDQIAPQWAQAYEKIPVLAKEYPTREQVLEKKPDLIAASYSSAFDEKNLGTRESFSSLGIATYVSPFACADKAQRSPSTWKSIEGEITDYGTMFARNDQAAEVISSQQSTLTEITKSASGSGKTVLWWDSNTDTPFVGGNSGGPQLIIDAVGATNIFAELDGNWGDGNWETVLQANPDVIVLADASWDTATDKRKFLESDPALKALKAVQAGAFVTIPFSESTPGPRLINGASALSAYFTNP